MTGFVALGLDLSLARSGIAVVDADHQALYVTAHETKSALPKGGNSTDAILREHYRRITAVPEGQLCVCNLPDLVISAIRVYQPDTIYIEQPIAPGGPAQNPITAMGLAMLHGIIRDRIEVFTEGAAHVNTIPGSTLKSYAGITMKGTNSAQKKREMVAKANEKWSLTLKIKQNDEADALFLADMAVTEFAPELKPARPFLGRPSSP